MAIGLNCQFLFFNYNIEHTVIFANKHERKEKKKKGKLVAKCSCLFTYNSLQLNTK